MRAPALYVSSGKGASYAATISSVIDSRFTALRRTIVPQGRSGVLVAYSRHFMKPSVGGTSPVVVGNLLYVAGGGVVNVYLPASGRTVAQLASGDVHWQSPIVADGRVAIPEGNANDHATSGVLDIYRLP